MPLVLAKSFFKLPYLVEPCWCCQLTGGILTVDLSVSVILWSVELSNCILHLTLCHSRSFVVCLFCRGRLVVINSLSMHPGFSLKQSSNQSLLLFFVFLLVSFRFWTLGSDFTSHPSREENGACWIQFPCTSCLGQKGLPIWEEGATCIWLQQEEFKNSDPVMCHGSSYKPDPALDHLEKPMSKDEPW